MDPITGPNPTPNLPTAPAVPVPSAPDTGILGLPSDLPALPNQVRVEPNAFGEPSGQTPAPATPATTPAAPTAPVTPVTPAAPTAPPPVDPFASLTEGLATVIGGKPATAAPQAPVNPNGPRDFTGLEPHEIEFFKQMSNGAYAHVYPKLIAARRQEAEFNAEKQRLAAELETAKKSRLYEHADAWKFDPEVQTLASNLGTIVTLKEFYTEQLKNVRSNKPWNDVVQNEKGELVTTAAQQPSVDVEVAIIAKLQELSAREQHIGAEVSQRQQAFKSEFKATYDNLNEMRNKILGPYEKVLAPLRGPLLEKFPKMMRERPETLIIVDLLNTLNTVITSRPNHAAANAGALATSAPVDPGAMTGQPQGGLPSIDEIERRLAQMEQVSRGEYVVPQPMLRG